MGWNGIFTISTGAGFLPSTVWYGTWAFNGFQSQHISIRHSKLVVPLQGCWDRSSSRARKHKNSKCPDGGIKDRIGLKNPQKVLSVEVLALGIHLIWTRFVASDTVIQSFSAGRFVFVSLVKCSPEVASCPVLIVGVTFQVFMPFIYLPWKLDELGLTSNSLTASKWTTGSLSYFIYFYFDKGVGIWKWCKSFDFFVVIRTSLIEENDQEFRWKQQTTLRGKERQEIYVYIHYCHFQLL